MTHNEAIAIRDAWKARLGGLQFEVERLFMGVFWPASARSNGELKIVANIAFGITQRVPNTIFVRKVDCTDRLVVVIGGPGVTGYREKLAQRDLGSAAERMERKITSVFYYPPADGESEEELDEEAIVEGK